MQNAKAEDNQPRKTPTIFFLARRSAWRIKSKQQKYFKYRDFLDTSNLKGREMALAMNKTRKSRATDPF
jgi:hypothetical protein